MEKDKIKSKIIQEFLCKSINLLGKEYNKSLIISDDMVDDEEMYIFIDNIYNKDDFCDENLYFLCLEDFKKNCERFIEKIDDELQIKHLFFVENWYGEHIYNDKKYYETCELHFKIMED